MKTQHTPGPWHVEKACGRYEIWPKDKGQTHTFVAIAQTEADAKLIAELPRILSALEAAAEWLNDMSCEHEEDKPDSGCVVCVVNQALFKAGVQ